MRRPAPPTADGPDSAAEVLRRRVELLEQVVATLPARLAQERSNPPPSDAEFAAVAERLRACQEEILREKALAKRHKREMKAWHSWFDRLPEEERVRQVTPLVGEARRRAEMIAAIEARIARAEAEKLQAILTEAALEERRAAAADGVDRRLESATRELEEARAALRDAVRGNA